MLKKSIFQAIILVAVVIVALPSESKGKRKDVQQPLEMTLKLYRNPKVFASIESKEGDSHIYKELNSSFDLITKKAGVAVNFTSDINKGT